MKPPTLADGSFRQLEAVLGKNPSLDPDHSLVAKLKEVYDRARWCGRAGASAAQRLSIAANEIERFAPATLEGFINPQGAAADVEAEFGRAAQVLAFLRNAFLLVALIVAGWYGWSTITSYQSDMANRPTDVAVPFISLWQTGFHGSTWSLGLFVLVSTCNLVCAALSGLIAIAVRLRARTMSSGLGAYLSSAVNELAAFSLSIDSASVNADPSNSVTEMRRVYSDIANIVRDLAEQVRELGGNTTNLNATVNAFGNSAGSMGRSASALSASTQALNANAQTLSDAVNKLLPAQQNTNDLLRQLAQANRSGIDGIYRVADSTSQLSSNNQNLAFEMEALTRQLADVSRELAKVVRIQARAQRKQSSGWWPFRRHQSSHPPRPQASYLPLPPSNSQQSLPAFPDLLSPVPAPSGSARRDTGSSTQPSVPTASENPIQDPRFTVLIRREIEVGTWQTMVVYAHEAAILRQVRDDAARRYADELGRHPRESTQTSLQEVERGTQITFIPLCEGLVFAKDRDSFKWLRDMHRAEFEFKADEHYAGESVNGRILVFGGPVLIAVLKFSAYLLPIGQHQTDSDAGESTTSGVVASIFASYSHEDEPVVVAVRNVCRSLRIQYNRDREALGAGQPYDRALLKLIEDSEYFQLFWSERAARSDYVRREWQHAISCGKADGHFLPVYWDDSLYPLPAELDNLRLAFVQVRMPTLDPNHS